MLLTTLENLIDTIKHKIMEDIWEYSGSKMGKFRYYSFDKDLRQYHKDHIADNLSVQFDSRQCIFRNSLSLEIYNLFFIENNLSIELNNELSKKPTEQLLSLVVPFAKCDYTYALAFILNEIVSRKENIDLKKVFDTFISVALSESFIHCFLNISKNVLKEVPFFARKGVPTKLALKFLLLTGGVAKQ